MFLLLLSKLSSIWLVSHFPTFVQESGRNFSDQITRKVFTVVLLSHAAWTVTYFLVGVAPTAPLVHSAWESSVETS